MKDLTGKFFKCGDAIIRVFDGAEDVVRVAHIQPYKFGFFEAKLTTLTPSIIEEYYTEITIAEFNAAKEKLIEEIKKW